MNIIKHLMINSFYVYFYFFSLAKRKEILCKSQQKNLARQIVMYLNVKIPNNFYANSEIELNFQDHICVFSSSFVSSKCRGAGCGGGGGGG